MAKTLRLLKTEFFMRINCTPSCSSFIKKAFAATIATVAIAAAIQAILRPDLNALVSMGNREIAPLPIQKDLIGAIFSQRQDEIAYFLNKETDLNSPGAEGYTPLAAAILTTNLPLVQSLLSQKADPNKEFCTKPALCTTPLMAAYVNKGSATLDERWAIVNELLLYGADMHAKDSNGISVLELARSRMSQWLEELNTTA
jgi:ankyrin repeat protein